MPAIHVVSRIGIIVICLLAPLAAVAETELTLEAALRTALDANPALAQTRARAAAMAAMPPQAGALPEPRLTLGALNVPVDTYRLDQEPMTQVQVGSDGECDLVLDDPYVSKRHCLFERRDGQIWVRDRRSRGHATAIVSRRPRRSSDLRDRGRTWVSPGNQGSSLARPPEPAADRRLVGALLEVVESSHGLRIEHSLAPRSRGSVRRARQKLPSSSS